MIKRSSLTYIFGFLTTANTVEGNSKPTVVGLHLPSSAIFASAKTLKTSPLVFVLVEDVVLHFGIYQIPQSVFQFRVIGVIQTAQALQYSQITRKSVCFGLFFRIYILRNPNQWVHYLSFLQCRNVGPRHATMFLNLPVRINPIKQRDLNYIYYSPYSSIKRINIKTIHNRKTKSSYVIKNIENVMVAKKAQHKEGVA